MSSTTARILLALFISLIELTSAEKANHPLKPRNVKLLPVANGLKVIWETPKDSENRPPEHYSIGYGKSIKHLRFIKVEKDIRSYIIEDVEPGVLYFVQMTAENHNGVSHPVYRAETSGGGEWVNLDGFAIMGPAAFKGPMTEKDVPRKPLRVRARPSEDSLSLKWRAPHLSGQNSTVAVRGYLLGVGESGRKMHYIPLQQDQRNHEIKKLASESMYVVSLQAQNALGQSPPVYRAVMTKKKASEPDELYEPKDITVRVMSPQSVFVSWVDPVYEKRKKSDISSTRHYTIRYREKGESARWDYKHTTQRRVLVDKLSSDNMYEFSVQISQGDRNGKWSVSVFQRTPESAPTSSPENFQVQPLKGKGTAVTATWEPPADTNGKLRASTVASSSHQQSRNPDFGNNDQSAVPPSRTSLTSSAKLPSSSSTSKDLKQNPASKTPNIFSHEVVSVRSQLKTDVQSTEEPDESELYPSEPVLPSPSKATTLNSRRKTHPISQTRSYHSILSSVRSPVRFGQSAIKQRPDTTTSSPYFKNKNVNGRQHPSSSRQTDLNEELDEELDEDTEEKHKELLSQKNTVHSKSKDDGHSEVANKNHSKGPNHKTDSLSVVPETSSGSSQPKFSRTSGNRSVSSIQKPHTFPNSESSKLRRPKSFSNRKSVSSSSVTQSSSSDVSSSTLSGNKESTALKNEHSSRSFPNRKETNLDLKNGSSSSSSKSMVSKSSSVMTSGGARLPVSSNRHSSTGFTNGRRTAGTGSTDSKSSVHQKGVPDQAGSTRVVGGQPKPGISLVRSQSVLPTTAQPSTRQQSSKTQDEDYNYEDYDYESSETEVEDEKPILSSKPNHASSNLPFASVPKGSPRSSHLGVNSKSTVSKSGTHSSSVLTSGGARLPVSSNRHSSTGFTNGRRTAGTGSTDSTSSVHQKGVPDQAGSTRVVGGQPKPGISLVRSQSVLPTTAQPSTRQQSSKTQDEDYNYEGYDYESSETEVEDEKPILSSKPNHASSNLPSAAVPKGNPRKSYIGVSSSKEIDDSVNKHSLSPTSQVNPTKLLPSGHNRSSLISNRNHRFSMPRQDTKLSSSFTQQNIATPSARSSDSQSLTPKHTQSGFDVSVNQETDEKEKTPISSSPSKYGHGSSGSQTSLPNRHSASSGSRKPVTSSHFNTSPSSSQGGSHMHTPSLSETVSEEDDYDYEYYGSKELYNKADKLSSASDLLKSVAPTSPTSPSVKQISSSKSSSPSVQSSSQLFTSSSNGRSHSSQLTNRQFGPRISGRVLPSQNTKLGGSSVSSSSPSSSASQSASTTNRGFSRFPSSQLPRSSSSQTTSSSLPSLHSSRQPIQGTRTRYPGLTDIATREKRPGTFVKPNYKQGKNGRPNLTDANGKASSTPEDKVKQTGRRLITGPQGAKWIVDLDLGVLMNEEERILQDSDGKPLRVQLGADGRSVMDHEGTPLLNPDGLPLFGHRRDSKPVISPKGKSVLSVGGKPLVGLERHITTTIQPTTTTTTTTTATTTTTPEPTIIPTTIEITTEVPTTSALPECPPGTYYKVDEDGKPVFGGQGILNCYPKEVQTTVLPTTEAPTTEPEQGYPETRPFNTSPSSDFDVAGKRRFTAPYVNFIRKDPGAPCSLTEALEYLQVDILEDLFSKDRKNQPPKNKPHNITVVAMEGCHSFVILDWARPVKGDMVSGYMVHSASYDDILNNRWSTKNSSGTHLPVENLKPNSRYYFRVQAKNNFGLGPISDTFTYVTESDDPLLIVRPPGGEPIWIPFSFKYTSTNSECKGSQYVKRTWYKKFVGVVLCNSLRYKIFMGDSLKDTFYSIGDTYGRGEDHCQFVDSHMEGRTGPRYTSNLLPTIPGFYRAYRQEPVHFGLIGSRTPHYYVSWYECGVPIPGKW
ncbi:fibronectin type III domain-containing protein 1-like isoform X2 [Polyodon spathula]|uniref:fibronectin type III domain-containing protein 1-like isoform X2 n=1 Tax=Polyodon spathula TaxID=7913 RepID=UPI001B7EDE77|nr:fibronectin type III domain-containing protein 1-like isoform X2 [Polyodon spathula]